MCVRAMYEGEGSVFFLFGNADRDGDNMLFVVYLRTVKKKSINMKDGCTSYLRTDS